MNRVFFITQGCSANIADSEVMAGLLAEAGYEMVGKAEDADLVIYNTCTVKGPTENEFIRRMRKLTALEKKIIVAGCIPQAEPSLTVLQGISVVGPYDIHKIAEAADQTLKGKTVCFLSRVNKPRLNLPKVRKNALVEIVPILHGCLGHCSYCKTKHARGHLHSYPINDIVRHVSKAVAEGAKEVWLTSQDCAAYGLDLGKTLPELLEAVCSIPRDFRVRVGMGNPEHYLLFLDRAVKAYEHEKIYKFLHVPVQSGSDEVLREMGREYTAADFMRVIRAFRKKMPQITVSTDIIVGYPTETEADFKKTLSLIRAARPDVHNLSRFWPRPGTPAAELKPLSSEVMKVRSKKTFALLRKVAFENNRKWVGWQGDVLVVEKGKGNTVIGRNFAYKQIVIEKGASLTSREKVKVVRGTSIDLRAVIQ
ncbi:MAG: tRNA (N(6)-L-threonylcarbamoyladenosine(37)-C(2))-methylthiotransferase [Nanoarchaeota archaeon]